MKNKDPAVISLICWKIATSSIINSVLTSKIHVQTWKMTLHTTSFSLKIDLKGSAVSSTCCPFRRHEFDSEHPQGSLYLHNFGFPRDKMPSPGHHEHQAHTGYTYTHATRHSCTENSKFLKLLLFVCVGPPHGSQDWTQDIIRVCGKHRVFRAI